jgi:hypothetical protein
MAGMVEDEWGRNKGGQRELTDVEDGILKHALRESLDQPSLTPRGRDEAPGIHEESR